MAIEKSIRIKVSSRKAQKNVDSLDSSMRRLGTSADTTQRAFSRLTQVATAVGSALAANQVIRYADAFTSAQNQIRQTTKTTQQLTERTNQLFEISNRARTSISATSELYTQLTLSTKDLNISTEQQLRLTETISKAFTVSGKTAAESAGAIRQLGQAFASGALRGDEFNSVAEGAPEIMRAIQQATGKTQGELRKLAATGAITSEVLVKSLLEYSDTIDQKANESTATFAQSMEIAANNMTQFVGESAAVQGAASAFGDAMVSITENLDLMVKLVSLVGAGMAARFIPQIMAATVAFTAGTRQVSIYTGAITKTSAASATAARALAGLRGVMGALGGPLGVILTAASALVIFKDDLIDTRPEVQKLDDKVKQLSGSFTELNEKQRQFKFANLSAQSRKLGEELEKVNQQIQNFGQVGGLLGGSENALAQLRNRSKELKEELERVNLEMSAIFEAGLQANLEGATTVSGDQLNRGSEEADTGAPSVELQEQNFLAAEQRKTKALQIQLQERRALNRAFFESLLVDQMNEVEAAKAHSELLLNEELARLEAKRQLAALEREEKIAKIMEQHAEDKDLQAQLMLESNSQALEMQAQFEEERLRIEAEAAQRSMQIEKMRTQQKLQTMDQFLRAGFALEQLFGSKSEKANLKRRKREARINGAAGIVRAWAEHSFYEAIAMTVAIAASTEAQIKAMESAGSGGKVSIPSVSAASTAERQEVPQQSSVVEIRGLTEVAEELRNLDPGEVLPVEYTQRIVASLDEHNRLSGGG